MNKKSILFFICLQWVVVSNAQWDSVGQNLRERSKYPDYGYVEALCTYQGKLVAGGFFDSIVNHIPAQGLAQWNGSQWDTITRGVEYPAALLVYNGNLVVLGYYPPQYSYIGQWDGSEWDTVGPRVGTFAQWGPNLTALCAYNGNLYMAGGGLTTDGTFDPGILKLDSGNWRGLHVNDVSIVGMTVYQNKLYLGGTFNVNGIHNIATWNDTVWAPVGTGVSYGGGAGFYGNWVSGLFVWNGKLYVGGLFDSAGGQPARNIAVWDGHTWSPLGKGINGNVEIFTAYHDTLIVGGEFDSAGEVGCNNIAEWDGSAWHAMGKGIMEATKGLEAYVNALCVYNGALYVGGQFDSAGGIYAVNIARWGTPNSTDTAVYTGALKIYPNPSRGMFTLQADSYQPMANSYIEIYNVLGQKIYTANLSPGLNQINLIGKASGIYLYKVTSANGGLHEGKLVIER